VLRLALVALAVAVAVAGCGGDDPPPRDPAAVRLTIDAPADGALLREDTVEVRGRVAPGRATVRIDGDPAPVSGGAFSATVELTEGVNGIDVSAGMPGRTSAFRALRVTHDPRVVVPDLEGVPEDEAADRITALGLDPQVDRVGGLLDELRSGDRRVCQSDPPPGSRLRPGDEVVLAVARRC
jgi:hypothetical protein